MQHTCIWACTHLYYWQAWCFLACLLQVSAFRASKFKVTNGEFAAFVRSSGYSTKKWWSEEGWSWRTFRNVKWPTFWVLGE